MIFFTWLKDVKHISNFDHYLPTKTKPANPLPEALPGMTIIWWISCWTMQLGDLFEAEEKSFPMTHPWQWCIYLHSPWTSTKRGKIYHTWILWVILSLQEKSQKTAISRGKMMPFLFGWNNPGETGHLFSVIYRGPMSLVRADLVEWYWESKIFLLEVVAIFVCGCWCRFFLEFGCFPK